MKYLALAIALAAAETLGAHAQQSDAAPSDCARILGAHWDHLSQGDRSVVYATLQSADVAVVTVEGSPLAQVYAELEASALMQRLDEGLPPPILQYGWTEQGRAQCASAVASR